MDNYLRPKQRDYSPTSWTEYFDEAHDVIVPTKSCLTCTPPNDHLTSDDICHLRSSPATINNDHHRDIASTTMTTTDSFRVYLKNFQPPFAPARRLGETLEPNTIDLSQSELNAFSQVPTLVMVHGGGYSALTWAEFTKKIEQQCKCRILAFDVRGHGDTLTQNPNQMDINTLVSDLIKVTHATHKLCGFDESPKLVLIGHSMGAAIVVKCATHSQEHMLSLSGFVVIDVVEGTAKEALPLMMSVINSRPSKFESLKSGVEWAVRSGMAKNSDAAKVSMPGNLLNLENGHLGIHDVPLKGFSNKQELLRKIKRHKFHIGIDQMNSTMSSPRIRGQSTLGAQLNPRISALKQSDNPIGLPPLPQQLKVLQHSSYDDMIEEEHEDCEAKTVLCDKSLIETDCKPVGCSTVIKPSVLPAENILGKLSKSTTDEESNDNVRPEIYKKPQQLESNGFVWRTNLAKTQPFWHEWFDGLSRQLLDAPVQGKFLLLAGIDRLDKALTIGQMQGKFMMKVLPKCGHAVHEDVPEQVASSISEFLLRNKFTTQT